MITEHIAPGVGPDHLDLVYRRHGKATDPTAVLIMGIAARLVNWAPDFINALTSRGLQVVVFDNRGASMGGAITQPHRRRSLS